MLTFKGKATLEAGLLAATYSVLDLFVPAHLIVT